jgi:glutamate synthase (NADPH/NADH) large chain
MSLQTQIGPECNIFVPAPEHAARSCWARRSSRSASCGRSWRSESGVTHEFIDLQYDEQEGSEDCDCCAVCAHAESRGARGKLVLLLSDRYLVKGKLPIARAARDGRRASAPGQDRDCAASAISWSRPAPRAIRIISPA